MDGNGTTRRVFLRQGGLLLSLAAALGPAAVWTPGRGSRSSGNFPGGGPDAGARRSAAGPVDLWRNRSAGVGRVKLSHADPERRGWHHS